ncbi:fatty acid desaturase [Myxococcus llanfairpwllgwyngyllgogerychwyrndrobwllllantysiliogogogochensis]|uniref:Fatty acid desaturase n=1 Tax=Myxococcus llanfairpwllgwyngyllgogerychwyrndrobwllllantysiliogogogochensis TaxID=2590453 RepID=A0A540X6Y7_9BACT|nr:fatty acid desaturase [Myxococcus llanfairpwllgwyngyllgogerychwyrndrobwllllantysiliogogogochensis]TQF17035.1 fatty acid desaturase [Myxococcus llanfairpwllgwyngyllgogerychwyrndrobwllllantysiliogogogochensis]
MSSSLPPAFNPASVDVEGFHRELKALRQELDANLGEADAKHLRKIERWGRVGTLLGIATCWLAPNPFSAAALSLGRSTRWLLMHHVGHRGYDRVPGLPASRTGKGFAKGGRRYLDWLDWMLPEAWVFEHNVLHHSHTGEDADPDLLERNAEGTLRNPSRLLALRYIQLTLLALTWRASYYAPETLSALRRKGRRDGGALTGAEWKELLLQCYLPYAAVQFVLFPALFLVIGPWAAFSAFCNSLMADVLTSVHTFLVVGPNHTGEDLYRFDDKPANKGERYVQQVIGSANYRTGGDLNDFAHLWLNYQIEHHIWPDLPMLKYREAQPKVRALCEKYGIPYVQESVWTRVRKMIDVVVGKASMRKLAPRERSEAPVDAEEVLQAHVA